MSDTHGEALRPEEHLATDGRHDVTLIERVVADANRFQNDAEAFSRLLAPDVVLVNVAGTRLVGRRASPPAARDVEQDAARGGKAGARLVELPGGFGILPRRRGGGMTA